jgi:TadE-like protein
MMPTVNRSIYRSNSGAAAAEFALVLPLFLLFLLGIIDVGRFMWALNTAEKATQMGARAAVVSNFVAGGLFDADYSATLGQGVPITTDDFGAASCKMDGGALECNCATEPCPTPLTPVNTATFDAIVARMSAIAPVIGENNVEIVYANSGLGYAGDPNGADIAPLVTVTASNLTFTPLIFQFFGASFSMPTISATLTMEDGQGAVEHAN